MKKTVSILLCLCLLAALFCGCGAKKEPAAAAVKFTVVYEDESSKEFELSTEQETLAEALIAAGLVSKEEGESGFVTAVDGVTADYNADQAWWKLVDADGDDSVVGIGDVKTAEADGYSFVYTIGF